MFMFPLARDRSKLKGQEPFLKDFAGRFSWIRWICSWVIKYDTWNISGCNA